MSEGKLAVEQSALETVAPLLQQHVPFLIVQDTGKIQLASHAACALSGYEAHELRDQPLDLLLAPEAQRLMPDFLAESERGRVWQGELPCRSKNGLEYWVDMRCVPRPNTEIPAGFVAFLVDISKNKRIEESLLDSERRFRFFADHVDEGTIVSDTGRIVDVSDVWATMFRCEKEHAIGKSPLDFTAPEVHQRVKTIISEMRTDSYESLMLRADGTKFPALVRGRQLEFRGRPVRLTTVLDISAQKRAAKALELAKEEAEKANQVKSQFLSSMSHELRTPLNAILGFAQLMEMPAAGGLTKRQLECVAHIKQGGEHLLSLINDILELSKVEAGSIDLVLEDVPLQPLLAGCVALTAPLAQQRGISVATVGQGLALSVRADPTRLRQVVLNFLSNAIKYNRPAGSVTLSVEPCRETFVRLAVQDTGIGIAEEKLSELFLPFSRLGAEATEVEGTGIGLAVSKNLVKLMGGSVGVASTKNVGSQFWIEMPRASAQVDPQQEEKDLRSSGTFRPIAARLLYVEDNPNNITLMEMLVEGIVGLSLQSAETGREGFEAALAHPPDLLVLDIHLPDMTGLELLEQLRAHPRTSKIPALALTAAATQDDIQRGMDAGFLRYLTRPIDVHEVVAAIRGALVVSASRTD